MKHSLVSLALIGALVASVSGCGSSAAPAAQGSTPTPADPKIAALVPASVKGHTISVAMDASYPPFESFASDRTTIVGFDADLATAILARMGLKAQLVNVGFDAILTGLASGRYDMADSAFSVTPEREKVVDFVDYLQGGSGLAVKSGNPLHLSMDPLALCGRNIAAQKGTLQAMTQLPEITKTCTGAGKPAVAVQLFPSENDTNLALASGRVDAVMSGATGIASQSKLSGGQIELAPGGLYDPAVMGIALPKGSPLTKAVSASLASLYADGTVKTLAEKWNIPASNLLPKSKA